MNKSSQLIKILATGLYIGYLPIAPATLASILSVIIWFFLIHYKAFYVILSIILFITGIIVSNELSKTMGKDPRPIVIDEYASLLLPLYFTPIRILPLIITFVLFRLFDVLKPFPLRRLEKLPGGLGIMLDDLGAAIYTTIMIIIVSIFVKL